MVFFVLGTAILVLAILAWSHAHNLIGNREVAQGTVIELFDSLSGERGRRQAPVVHFNTADGRDITCTGTFVRFPAPYSVGDPVEVLYSPDDPSSAEIRDFESLWLLPFLMGGFGLCFVIVGAFVFYFAGKTARGEGLDLHKALRVLPVAGGLLLVIALFLGRDSFNLVANGEGTHGRIAEIVKSKAGRRTSFTRIVRFSTLTGRKITFRESFGSGKGVAVGSAVEVLYLADNPRKARIRSFGSLWLVPSVIGGAGIFFIVISVAVIRSMKRQA
jgi:hypothetical protein